MLKIHFVNNPTGGVGAICERLSSRGDCVYPLSRRALLKYIKTDTDCEIYFHQPRSHLYCLIFSLFHRKIRSSLVCVLHESSNYNTGATNFIRSTIGTYIRRSVIYLNYILGVRVAGVSAFVLRSYGIHKGDRISYVNLFEKDLNKLIFQNKCHTHHLNESTLTAWVRVGDHDRVTKMIKQLSSNNLVRYVNIFGNESEVGLIKEHLSRDHPSIQIISNPHCLPHELFLAHLDKSTWFLSLFKNEGFGLSVLEALSAGCVCLVPRSGAIPEWLPEENYAIFNDLQHHPERVTIERVVVTSKNNKMAAKEMIS